MSSIPSSILSGPTAGGAKHPPPEGSGGVVAVRVGVTFFVGVAVRVGVRDAVGDDVGVYVGTNITMGVSVAPSSVDYTPLGVAVALKESGVGF